MEVRKRDGRLVKYDSTKIMRAVERAMVGTEKGEDEELAYKVAVAITNKLTEIGEPIYQIEDIQDIVEAALMRSRRPDVAKAYILYRAERSRARAKKSAIVKLIGEKINAVNVENSNANVDEASFGGRRGEAADAVLKQYALDNLVSPMTKASHLNNEIYIHDLNSYAVGMSNCLSIPFDDLLANGFKTRQTDVRPAGSINTAFQLVAVIFQLQSLCQFGGCSATHLDHTMVPYVRKSFAKHYCDGMLYLENKTYAISSSKAADISIEDRVTYESDKAYECAMDMTKRELKQAVEGMFHNLNIWATRQ